MSIIGDLPSTMAVIQSVDLKRLRKSMSRSEERKRGNTGACTKELTDQEALKLWKVLMPVLDKLYAYTTQKTKELQSKT